LSIDSEALSEVDFIIGLMSKEDYSKIPVGLIGYIKERKSKTYIPNIREDVPLAQQKLKKDTKTLCSLIYRNCLCSTVEKQRLAEEDKELLKQLELEHSKSYNLEEVLRKKRNIQQNEEVVKPVENVQMVSYEKPKWYKKLFEKIIHLIKK